MHGQCPLAKGHQEHTLVIYSDWMLSEGRGNSVIGYLNNSYLEGEETNEEDKSAIGKELVVIHFGQKRGIWYLQIGE